MGNLKLITTENFGNLECNFYRNMNDDILLTREQIGQALEYSNPAKAIQKIHLKHKDRLDDFSIRIKSSTTTRTGVVENLMTETIYYTQRGIMEICRWSRQPLANKFMDWVWNIIEKYRSNEIMDMSRMTTILNKFVDVIEKQERRLSKIEKQLSVQQEQLNKLTTYKKPNNPWFVKMHPKYKLLEEDFNITRGELYKEILMELKKTYGLDPYQIQADYCYENNLETCYPLEPYEFVPKYRKMIEEIIHKNLLKYRITKNDQVLPCEQYKTIFDTPVEKKEK